ncbi:MAG: hypothetical protein M3Q44_05700 [bacterium]|nr:hypothetical protein [bacterium]
MRVEQKVELYEITDPTDLMLLYEYEIPPGGAIFSPRRIGSEESERIAQFALKRVLSIFEGSPDPATYAIDTRPIAHLDERAVALLDRNVDVLNRVFEDDRIVFKYAEDVAIETEIPSAFNFAAKLRNVKNRSNSTANRDIMSRIKNNGRAVALLELLYASYGLNQINTVFAYAGSSDSDASDYNNVLSGEQLEPLIILRDQLRSVASAEPKVSAPLISDVHAQMIVELQGLRFFNEQELDLARTDLFGMRPATIKGQPVCEVATHVSELGEKYMINAISSAYFKIENYPGLALNFGAYSFAFISRRRLS